MSPRHRAGVKGGFGLRAVLVVAAMLAAMAIPAQALAGSGDPSSDPTAAQYAHPQAIVAAGSGGGGSGAGGASGQQAVPVSGNSGTSSGSLPFTGFDLLALAIVAVALGGTGLTLRRLTTAGGAKG